MKNFLKIWLFAFLPLFAVGQKFPATVELDLSGYATKSELNSLQRQIDSLKGVPTKPELAKCERGPTPVAITKITTTSANVTFDADGVPNIDWRVVSVSDTTILHSKGAAYDLKTNQFTIVYAGLAPGQYKLLLDAVDCKGHGSRNFTVPVTTIPVVNCPRGPDILRVEGVTAFGLTAIFDGEGVIKLAVTTRSADGGFVRYDTISPTSSAVSVRYSPKLKPGTYLIKTLGVSCVGGSPEYKTFTINEDTGGGGGVPPVDPVKGEIATISSGLPEHMNLEFKKDGDSYLISDLSTPDQIGGSWEYRYMIGSDIVRTGRGLLTNYRFGGTNPGRIIKYKIKPGLILNNWTSRPDEVNGYYSLDAGEGFSFNTSIPFQSIAFPGAAGDFINPIPHNYNPSTQNVQWGDIATDIKLPKGHYWVAWPKPWGIEKAMRSGVTNISNYALPWEDGPPYTRILQMREKGVTYEDVPRIENKLGIVKTGNTGLTWHGGVSKDWYPEWGDDSTVSKGLHIRKPGYKEGYEMGLRTTAYDALSIGEYTENTSFLPADADVWLGFYDAVIPRYDREFKDKGVTYDVVHDYLTMGIRGIDEGGRAGAKSYLKLRPEQMTVTRFSPGKPLSRTTMIVSTVYLGAPDMYAAQPYQLLYTLELYKQMGYKAGVFLSGAHEWRPNNKYRVNYPEGEFYLNATLPLDPNIHITNVFMAHAHGSLFIEWGARNHVTKKVIPQDWASGLWYPKGATSPQGGFPYFTKPGDESYYGYSGSADLSYFGTKLFADTYGKVEGGKDQYLKFRLDGGAWINPTEKDYIDAYYDKRGFVHSRTLNGRTAFYYLNSFGGNSWKKLEIELPNGQIWSGKVAGNGVHAKLL